MSQSEFARRCGIGVAAWNNAETGDNRIGLDKYGRYSAAVIRLTRLQHGCKVTFR